mmetsp:Transcript_7492/g.17960  ORF Transcript_7492/g.17960 Transcript_7492/m.17960 type:complete len:578 (-) Transcript_7492:2213-3946(-)
MRDTLVAASNRLQCCFEHSFGPEGFYVLVVRSSGDALLTRQGEQILNSVSTSNPVAHHLVQAIQEFSYKHGDGTSSLAVAVAAALTEACSLAPEDGSPGFAARGLQSNKDWIESELCGKLLDDAAVRVPIGDNQSCARMMAALLFTSFATRLDDLDAAAVLAGCVTELVMGEIEAAGRDCAEGAVAGLCRSPPIAPSASGSLRLVAGRVVQRPLRSASMAARLSPVRVAVLGARLEGDDGADAAVQVGGAEGLRNLFEGRDSAAVRAVAALARAGVNLVLSTEAISDAAAFLLAQSRISAAQFVPEAEARRAAAVCGCCVLRACTPAALEAAAAASGGFGHAEAAEPWAHAPGRPPWLLLRPSSRHCRTLAIGGAGETQRKVTEDAARAGFRLLTHAIVRRGGECILSVVPGAGAVDAAIAAEVGARIEARSGGGGAGDCALRALRAAAEAVPRLLAQRGAARPVELLTELRARHRREGRGCRAGIVFATHAHRRASPTKESPSTGGAGVADALAHGCCHATEVERAKWSALLAMALQVLSVDRILATGRVVKDAARRRTAADPEGSDSGSDSSAEA